MSAVNPPVPVQLKLVASFISRLVDAVEYDNKILPEPNMMLRVLVLDDENRPTFNVIPDTSNVPDIKLYVLVVAERL